MGLRLWPLGPPELRYDSQSDSDLIDSYHRYLRHYLVHINRAGIRTGSHFPACLPACLPTHLPTHFHTNLAKLGSYHPT